MTNNNLYTDIEQSQKLIELGLNPDSADMSYSPIMGIDEGRNCGYLDMPDLYPYAKINDVGSSLYLPCWSLSALLEIMPCHISGVPKRAAYHLALKKYKEHWECCYEHFSFGEIHTQKGNTQFEAAYNMMCWLLENNNIKTEEK